MEKEDLLDFPLQGNIDDTKIDFTTKNPARGREDAT